ncbi:hypothetical protein HHL21_08025 [Massilia sp. RP-1-19]|uniref:Uncharacterized protein n=1 Tax=Massilia polaris TaxID=2728846 RepID=A0A848HHZ8_9BURK|nr:hypothetical protein [Massilia polaris]NML61025.1 hypothetical protein [Massilia polaris]
MNLFAEHKKKPLCETCHTAVFCLIQAQLAITDGCWSGTAMLLLEPGQFSLLVPELLAPVLLPFQELLLALPLELLAWLLEPLA